MGALVTLVIGYYMAYRSGLQVGLCFASDHPGIRRACILDLGGGVMSMSLGVLLLFIEFASAYINRKDVSFPLLGYVAMYIFIIILCSGKLHFL